MCHKRKDFSSNIQTLFYEYANSVYLSEILNWIINEIKHHSLNTSMFALIWEIYTIQPVNASSMIANVRTQTGMVHINVSNAFFQLAENTFPSIWMGKKFIRRQPSWNKMQIRSQLMAIPVVEFSVDFWHRKLTLKVKLWHFLTSCHTSNSQNSIISFDYS